MDADIPDPIVATEFQIVVNFGSLNRHDEANAVDAGQGLFDI